MLTSLLAVILICVVGAGIYTGHGVFFRKIVCFCIGLYAAIMLTPLILPTISGFLSAVLPLPFIRIILALVILVGVYVITKRIWTATTSKAHSTSIEDAPKKSFSRLLLGACVNACFGFFIFIMLLLGYAAAVDYKIAPPIVSSEIYYQTIANKASELLLNKVPKLDYIVTARKASPQRKATDTAGITVTEEDDYSNVSISPHKQSGTGKTSAQNNRKPVTHRATIQAPEIKKPFEFPDINLDQKDVEALQELVTDEVKTLLTESPDELKRALSDVLTEEKGLELSAIVDEHIKNGRSVDSLMEKIERIMGDPNNLSEEFKEALPDLMREIEGENN